MSFSDATQDWFLWFLPYILLDFKTHFSIHQIFDLDIWPRITRYCLSNYCTYAFKILLSFIMKEQNGEGGKLILSRNADLGCFMPGGFKGMLLHLFFSQTCNNPAVKARKGQKTLSLLAQSSSHLPYCPLSLSKQSSRQYDRWCSDDQITVF